MHFFKITIFLFIAVLGFLCSGSVGADAYAREYSFSGKTMGTFYSVKFISNQKPSLSAWEKKVEVRLKDINKKLSMFDPKSELSRFNQYEIKRSMNISADFYSILLTGQRLYTLTHGAWDGTIKPLVDLWGFGTTKGTHHVPAVEEISIALSNTGFDHIMIQPPHTAYKNRPIALDLGSIAKGYGVDKIAALFLSAGIRDVLVEIGGELYASGKNKKGKPWGVGISRPDKTYANQDLYAILNLNNQAIATSGDYRNFFKEKGEIYSHLINPKTGFPIKTNIVSASVITDNCTFADGLATALMVMDVQKGLNIINQLDNTECLIITQTEGRLVSHPSQNFNTLEAKK